MSDTPRRSFIRHSRAYYARRYPLRRHELERVSLRFQYPNAERHIEVVWYNANGDPDYPRWIPQLTVSHDEWAFFFGDECADLRALLSIPPGRYLDERIQPNEFCEALIGLGFVDATVTRDDRTHALRELKAQRDKLTGEIESLERGDPWPPEDAKEF